jgi:6-phospho-3-hexuloisomerase
MTDSRDSLTLTPAEMEAMTEAVVAEIAACLRHVPAESLVDALRLVEGASRIFLAGAGRTGLCIRALAMRLMHLGKTTYVVGETTTPGIAAADLLIIGSGSGQTSSLLAMAEKAREKGARLLVFTIDAESPLGRLADHRVVIPAPSPKAAGVAARPSLQPMGTLFEQCLLVLFDSLILGLMQRAGESAPQTFARHANLE